MSGETEIVASIAAYGSDPSEATLSKFLNAIGEADGYMLSDGGSPLAPNPRIVTGRDRRKWIAAFSSVERAAKARSAHEGILRAPMPLIGAAARAPGISGVILNYDDETATLVEGRSLRAIAAMAGSRHPVAMVDANYPATLMVRVTAGGAVEVEGTERTIDALRGDLVALKEQGGIVQYTRDAPSSEPSDETTTILRQVLDLIAELKLPITFVEQASETQIQSAMAESRARGGSWWRRFLRH